MGLGKIWRSAAQKQAETAADQIFKELVARRGTSIEIPMSYTREDPMTRAILALRRKYGKFLKQSFTAGATTFQLGDFAVTPEALRLLNSKGWFAEPDLSDDLFLAAGEGFLRQNTQISVEEAQKKAQEAREKGHNLVIARR